MLKEINPDESQGDITEELWNYVYERDNGLCQICGKAGTEIHHIIFKSHGGNNFANNLILLCYYCHHVNIHLKYNVTVQDLYKRVKQNEQLLRESLV